MDIEGIVTQIFVANDNLCIYDHFYGEGQSIYPSLW